MSGIDAQDVHLGTEEGLHAPNSSFVALSAAAPEAAAAAAAAPAPLADADAADADAAAPPLPNFYVRLYSGHHGRYGHEFVEMELLEDGRLTYANHSKYRNDEPIKKAACVSPALVEEVKRIVRASGILDPTAVDDSEWPAPDKSGRQELEVRLDGTHVSFATRVLTTAPGVNQPPGLDAYYHLSQDLRRLVLTLMTLHHRVRAM